MSKSNQLPTKAMSALFTCGLFCVGLTAVGAQERANAQPRALAFAGNPAQLSLLRSRQRTAAAEMRRAWLASGHALPTDSPTLLSGKILSPRVNVAVAPAMPAISIKFTTGSAGLNNVNADFVSNTTGQVFEIRYYVQYKTPAITKGTLKFQDVPSASQFVYSPLTLYSAPGKWTLTGFFIGDQAGNSTFYDQDQLATLFPNLTITVTNEGTPDKAAPIVTAGKVLTPTVSLSSPSPDFGASLTVSDDLSGVFQACVMVEPPGGSSFCDFATPPAPVVNGKLNAWNYLGDHQTTGTWTIIGYEVCDVPGNCLTDTNSSDVQALFGTTTFNVTN